MWCVALVMLAACGRIGFDTSGDGGTARDTAIDVSPTDPLVQHGMATLGGQNLSVTIDLVDPAHSFLVFTTAVANSDPQTGQVVGQLAASKLAFERILAGPPISISWYVITHPDLRVQRGASDIDPTPTIPLAVDIAHTFPIVSHATGGTDYNEDDYMRTRLHAPQDLTLEIGAGGTGPRSHRVAARRMERARCHQVRARPRNKRDGDRDVATRPRSRPRLPADHVGRST